VRPNRVRTPTDRSFTSRCSPPRLAATQLRSVSGRRAYARRGLAPLCTRAFGGAPRIARSAIKRISTPPLWNQRRSAPERCFAPPGPGKPGPFHEKETTVKADLAAVPDTVPPPPFHPHSDGRQGRPVHSGVRWSPGRCYLQSGLNGPRGRRSRPGHGRVSVQVAGLVGLLRVFFSSVPGESLVCLWSSSQAATAAVEPRIGS
jgi:hypothetical protein